MEKKKINLVFSEKLLEKIDATREEFGITSKNAFFHYAASFFLWAINQKKAGRSIASFDDKERILVEFLLPTEVDDSV